MTTIIDKARRILELAEKAKAPRPWGYYHANKDDIGTHFFVTLYSDESYYLQPSVYGEEQTFTCYDYASAAANQVPELATALLKSIEVLEWYGSLPKVEAVWQDGGQRARDLLKELGK